MKGLKKLEVLRKRAFTLKKFDEGCAWECQLSNCHNHF